jgi:hypothetical protein
MVLFLVAGCSVPVTSEGEPRAPFWVEEDVVRRILGSHPEIELVSLERLSARTATERLARSEERPAGQPRGGLIFWTRFEPENVVGITRLRKELRSTPLLGKTFQWQTAEIPAIWRTKEAEEESQKKIDVGWVLIALEPAH